MVKLGPFHLLPIVYYFCCFMYVYVVFLFTLVVKTTVYLTDLNDYAAINSAYSEGKSGKVFCDYV